VGTDGASVFGIVLATLVGLVIVGGVQRIGAATSKIVPAMVTIYVLAALFIIFTNITKLPSAVATIFTMAFSENAAFGGVVGVMVMGFTRASFSNEAGIGSAAIAHAAAKTKEPVREGFVAMLEPVIDTHLVCLMTAIVVVITGVWNDPALSAVSGDLKGVQLTSAAFGQEIAWFPYVLTVSVLLFAYSTMISWAYYGERGWIYLVDHLAEGAGQRTLIVYRLIFVGFVYVGSVTKLGHVLAFSDYMILCMAFPNIVGGLLLAPRVRAALDEYWRKLRAGAFTIASPPEVPPSPRHPS
jgi:AGCS family alanine or glycine:cation symporter